MPAHSGGPPPRRASMTAHSRVGPACSVLADVVHPASPERPVPPYQDPGITVSAPEAHGLIDGRDRRGGGIR